MGTTNFPKFILPNAFYPAIHQSLPPPKFPSIRYLEEKSMANGYWKFHKFEAENFSDLPNVFYYTVHVNNYTGSI